MASPVLAQITTIFDQAAWNATAGGDEAIHYIDFGTLPLGTYVTDQFASLGAHFTDGDDMRVNVFVPFLGRTLPGLLSSPHYMSPPPTGITMEFDTPQAALAIQIANAGLPTSFYDGDRLIASIVVEAIPYPYFLGFVSDEPFDRVEFEPSSGGYYLLSNTYFSAVPAPGGLALLAAATLLPRRRRSA